MSANKATPGFVIVGLGDTGLSVAKYLMAQGQAFKVVDTRSNPPGLAELRRLCPHVEVELGEFQSATFLQAGTLIVSPGVSRKSPQIVEAQAAGVTISGDIDIFSQAVDAPIIAVTGSNGKSTVVAMLAAILRQAGVDFGLGGNLDGANFRPALALLEEGKKELYVLELSSFQLETTRQLNAAVAVILNVSADHMDRYRDLEEYRQAKQAVFNGCRQVVINRDDATSRPLAALEVPVWTFGLGEPEDNGVGLVTQDGCQQVVWRGQTLVAVDELKVVGQHNVNNVMAAAALALAAGIKVAPIRAAMQAFAGLPHRCQWVARINGVNFYNDSKGTNVGATIAAIEGLGARTEGRIVLIAGGVGKGADFSSLAPVVERWTRQVILLGQDAMQIAEVLTGQTQITFAQDMQNAVELALRAAAPGDAVLLSPACASFDMFDNFQHRGFTYIEAVEKLA